jgi:hypothetical protein
LKAAVKTQDATIKAKHKEFQTLQLESGMFTHYKLLITEQLTGDMTSAQEQVDEASAAMDAIVKEVESLEQDHTKQKVPPPFPSRSDQ